MFNLPFDVRCRPVMTYEGDALPIACRRRKQKFERADAYNQEPDRLDDVAGVVPDAARAHTGQDDIVVATPVAGRRSVDTESLIGFFVNTLLIRTKLSGNPRVREAIDRVRDVMLEAQTHQDLPFEKLVEQLHPERSLSHGPLFEVMFVFTSKPRTLMEVQEISISLLELVPATEKFGLTFEISEGLTG